ncbi:hypothetical protein ACH5RR_041040 [Cinchona calisaya]|uniref:Uncharacterized protein n=1 Tax=Cinchona calisaya TaxID=153742 RepID=A0ABD2XTX0_9GENT
MVFVGRCSGRALSFLCPILSYQRRLTSYQPAKSCEAEPGTKNESISDLYTEVTGRRPLNCSSTMQWCWFRFDKGRMPGRRSSTVGSRRVRFGFGSQARTIYRRSTILAATYIFLDLTDSSN